MLCFGAQIAKISNRRKYPLYGMSQHYCLIVTHLFVWGPSPADLTSLLSYPPVCLGSIPCRFGGICLSTIALQLPTCLFGVHPLQIWWHMSQHHCLIVTHLFVWGPSPVDSVAYVSAPSPYSYPPVCLGSIPCRFGGICLSTIALQLPTCLFGVYPLQIRWHMSQHHCFIVTHLFVWGPSPVDLVAYVSAPSPYSYPPVCLGSIPCRFGGICLSTIALQLPTCLFGVYPLQIWWHMSQHHRLIVTHLFVWGPSPSDLGAYVSAPLPYSYPPVCLGSIPCRFGDICLSIIALQLPTCMFGVHPLQIWWRMSQHHCLIVTHLFVWSPSPSDLVAYVSAPLTYSYPPVCLGSIP